MRLKLKFKVLLLLMITCLAAGLYAGFRISKTPSKAAEPWVAPDAGNQSKKFISKETLVNQIQQKQELIPFEVELTEKVTVDDSWGSLDIFKKIQNIYLVGKGIYVVDLDMLTPEKLQLDQNKKTVTVNIPKPIIKTISIDEQKTVYEMAQLGSFRFGDMKLTPAEYQLLMGRAKSRMIEKMYTPELYEQAQKNTEMAMVKLLTAILGSESTENYNISVKLVD